MFICEICRTTSAPGDKMHKIVVDKRFKAYTDGKVTGYGEETVKEKSACAKCAGVEVPSVPAATIPNTTPIA